MRDQRLFCYEEDDEDSPMEEKVSVGYDDED